MPCTMPITWNKNTFMEASCINTITATLKLCETFFSDRVKELVAYFGLYEFSLHF